MFKKKTKRPSSLRSKASSSPDPTEEDGPSTLLAEAVADRATADPSKRQKLSSAKAGGEAKGGAGGSAKATSGDPLVHHFSSDLTAGRANKTFATLETETSSSTDTRAVLEANLKSTLGGTSNDDTGVYTGAANYKAIIPKSLDSIRSNKATGFSGPLRANTTIRVTSRFDYQPDVCKDYKETGFCGFGDTCVFMHDRGGGPTAGGLEDEWEKKRKDKEVEQEKAMKQLLCQVTGEEEPEKEKVDDLPFACNVCRGDFSDPQETACSHYFCGKCITSHYKKSPACPVCKKDLGGVFKRPDRLLRKKKRTVGEGGTWGEFREACEKKKQEKEDEEATDEGE